MSRGKLTTTIRARLETIAGLIARIPTYKQLEEETGLSRHYIAVIVSRKAKELRNKIIIETKQ